MKKKQDVPWEQYDEKTVADGKKRKNEQTTCPADGIPDYVFESLAHCALPIIQAYYETEEGRKAYEEWKAKR
ncbi:MAG: hypothetical protein IKP38_07545 [Clostridia bacterium]|nr:hypothetical protein [Clostridia bacterium]